MGILEVFDSMHVITDWTVTAWKEEAVSLKASITITGSLVALISKRPFKYPFTRG
jgi:hypothetical protein